VYVTDVPTGSNPLSVLTVVAETVVGMSGVIPAPKGYFRAMKSVCRKYGALFILDEVTCGMGRKSAALRSRASPLMVDIGMGVTHAWELYGDNEPPDIQAVGKGLGGGSAIPRPRFLLFVLTIAQVCMYRCSPYV
jgi:acetylornithine/succinyldiaminopimelate/putrescine aminotransferase